MPKNLAPYVHDTDIPKKADINKIAENLGLNTLTGGIAIPKEADIDTYTTIGNYYSPNSETSQGLINSPITGSGFSLKVSTVSTNQLEGTNNLIQRAVGTNGVEFFRTWTSSTNTWSAWKVISLRPTLDTIFATSVTPVDNTIYEWTMTDNLTINATTNTVCPYYGSHFILITDSDARTLTINAITVSGNVATSLPANTQWEITVLRGRVIMTQTK